MKTPRVIVVVFVSLLVAAGCDQNRSGPVATEAVESAPAPAKRGAELYSTKGPTAAIPAGTEQTIEVTIQPSAGFKINKLFNWNFEFHPTDAVQLQTAEVAMDDLTLEDSHATIPVKVAAVAPGEHELVATGNFSVCNDDKCELYRDREITFQIAAVDGP